MTNNSIIKSLILLVALSFVVCCVAVAADSKVGFIDLQRLVKESKMGQSAAKELDRLREEKQTELDKKSKEIEKLKADIEKNADKMKLETKREKVQKLQDAGKVYQRMAQDAKESIERRDKEIVAEILTKVAPVLKKVAEREQYTMIIKDKDALAYLDASVNITDEVLKEIDGSGK